MPCSRGGLSLGVPPSSLAWGSSDESLQRQRVHIGGLVEWRSGGLLSGRDVHLVWLRDLNEDYKYHCIYNLWLNLHCPQEGEQLVVSCVCSIRTGTTEHHRSDSAAVSPSDGSPPETLTDVVSLIWRLLLRTSGGGATMQNEPWLWPEVREIGTDDGTVKINN